MVINNDMANILKVSNLHFLSMAIDLDIQMK